MVGEQERDTGKLERNDGREGGNESGRDCGSEQNREGEWEIWKSKKKRA